VPIPINELLERVSALPALPAVVQRLSQALARPDTPASEIAAIVQKDQSIASRLLRAANSPYYGFSRTIASINQAVVLLGTNTVRNLVLTMSVFQSLPTQQAGVLHKRKFWEHSICSGVAARRLAPGGPSQRDEAFIAGVLHDIGKLALDLWFPKEFAQAIRYHKSHRVEISQAEREAMGCDHQYVGQKLAEQWAFPYALVESIAKHHTPHRAEDFPETVAAVHAADIICHGLSIGQTGTAFLRIVDRGAWELLGLDSGQFKRKVREILADYLRAGALLPTS